MSKEIFELAALGALTLALGGCNETCGNPGVDEDSCTPCVRRSDCASGYECVAGACAMPPAVDASVEDAFQRVDLGQPLPGLEAGVDAASETQDDAGDGVDGGTEAPDMSVDDMAMPMAVEYVTCPSGGEPVTDIEVTADGFAPMTADTAVGSIVKVSNRDTELHTFTQAMPGDGEPVRDESGFHVTIPDNNHACLRFNVAGTYPFFTMTDPSLRGTLTVM